MTPPIYVRASVVIRRGDSILMIDRTNDAPFQRYILPGGSVEVNEYSHNAVVREAYEEIGVQVADPVFLGMREFVNADWFGVNLHQIHLHYLCRVTDPTFYERDTFPIDENGKSFTAVWRPITSLDQELRAVITRFDKDAPQ